MNNQKSLLPVFGKMFEKLIFDYVYEHICGPLFFLVYLNDLSDDLKSDVKMFADDASLFTVVNNVDRTAEELNSDLSLLSTRRKITLAKIFLCLQARFRSKVEWVSTFERHRFSASQSDCWKRSLLAEYSA